MERTLYHIEYVGHWGATVMMLTIEQAHLWMDSEATVKPIAPSPFL